MKGVVTNSRVRDPRPGEWGVVPIRSEWHYPNGEVGSAGFEPAIFAV